MSSSNLTGLAQTVLGPVAPGSLGRTTTHEHLLIDFLCMFHPPDEASERFKAFQPVTLQNLGWINYDPFRNKDNLELLDEETAISEALMFKRWGGQTIVDATTIGIGRDPLALSRIAHATGLNIIMGAGFYTGETHPPGMNKKSDQDISRQIIEEITTGVGETEIKAGIIGELGCSWPLTENERKVLRAGAAAQRETGAAILIHPGRNETAPFEILDVLVEAGANISRVVMGHIDRTIHDMNIVLDLANRGCYLEYDLFGWETSYYGLSPLDMPNDAQRIGFVMKLIEEGYKERIVFAQDVFCKTRLSKYGGHGYHHILEHIVPRMLEKGISEENIHSILVDNPSRILSFD